MDRAFGLHRLVPFTALARAHRCELFDPWLVAAEFQIAGGRNRLTEEFAAIGDYTEFDAAAAPDLLGLDIHLDDARVRRDQAVASASREPDTRA